MTDDATAISQLLGEDDASVYSPAAAESKISSVRAKAIPVITPNKAAIEKETGRILNMTADSDFKGANP